MDMEMTQTILSYQYTPGHNSDGYGVNLPTTTTPLIINKPLVHNSDGYGEIPLNYNYLFEDNSNRYGDGDLCIHHYLLKCQQVYNT